MTTVSTVTRYCGVRTRRGTKCRREAGWGTKHVGRGPCKLHGGCTPGVEKKYGAEVAIDFAVSALGAEVATDPLQAMLQSVRLASGVVAFYRSRLARAEAEGEPTVTLTNGYIESLRDLNRFSKAALDSDVDSRLVAIAERVGDAVVAAVEEGLAELPFLTPQHRTMLARAVESGLARREPQTIEGSAHAA